MPYVPEPGDQYQGDQLQREFNAIRVAIPVSINDLEDVEITNVQPGDVLKWDAVKQLWVNLP